MAEVGQRLGSGAYRLTALRSGPGRPVGPGEGPGAPRGTCRISGGPSGGGPAQERRRGTGRGAGGGPEEVSEGPTGGGAQVCASSSMVDSAGAGGLIQTRDGDPRTPPLQEELLVLRRSSWTRGVSLRSPQQLRALCTFTCLTGQGSEGHRLTLKHLRPSPEAPTASPLRRSYTSSKDPPLLLRSRTAYYDVLRVSPSATQAQIKTAYYQQSLIHHPDRNPGSQEASRRFWEISEAYRVLGSVSLRRRYDRGLLTQAHLQDPGTQTPQETRSTGSPHQRQQRARTSSQTGGRPMFDFDAFYQGHYGEQLRREREAQARRRQAEEQRREAYERRRKTRTLETTAALLLAMAGLILINISQS